MFGHMWLDLRLGNVRWRVATDWRDVLLNDDGLRLAEWRARGFLETLKQAPHRTIQRLRLPQGVIYVKHYPLHDFRARLRQLVRPSKARAEFDKALQVAARGVPTIEPLAFGETPQGESFLLTRGLAGVEPLNRFIEQSLPALPEQQQTRLRMSLAAELARLLARMHSAGVLHRDLHAGNILVQLDPVRLFLIDLHSVRLSEPLDWPRARDNLVMLNRWFVQRSSRPDRRRFWRFYLAEHEAHSKEEDRRKALELEQLTWASCLRFWRQRDRRWQTSNRYVYRHRANGNHGWAVRDLPVEVFVRLTADPDAPCASSDRKVLKSSRSSTVVELPVELPAGVRPGIYKRFAVTRWTDPWLATARATPAFKSWLNGHRLLECGLPTARPLAVVHRRKHGLVRECYLLTEKLPGVVELNPYVQSMEAGPDRQSRLRPLLEQLARLIRALHDRQFAHRDLKAANVLVQWEGEAPAEPRILMARQEPRPPGSVRLFLIDLVGLGRWRKLPRSRKVQNLARLNASALRFPWVTRTDRLRFLRVYLAWGLRGKTGWKDWWRQIAQKTHQKVQQNLARGRPLA